MRYCNNSFRSFFSGSLDIPWSIQHLCGFITRLLCLIGNQRTKNSTNWDRTSANETTLNPLKTGKISNKENTQYFSFTALFGWVQTLSSKHKAEKRPYHYNYIRKEVFVRQGSASSPKTNRTSGNGLKLHHGRFGPDIRKNVSTKRLVKHWNRLLGSGWVTFHEDI